MMKRKHIKWSNKLFLFMLFFFPASTFALHYSSCQENYGDRRLKLIAVSTNGDDYNWTDAVMKNRGTYFRGISLHYYTWINNATATGFKENGWFQAMKETLQMEGIVSKHSAVMEKYDPAKSIDYTMKNRSLGSFRTDDKKHWHSCNYYL